MFGKGAYDRCDKCGFINYLCDCVGEIPEHLKPNYSAPVKPLKPYDSEIFRQVALEFLRLYCEVRVGHPQDKKGYDKQLIYYSLGFKAPYEKQIDLEKSSLVAEHICERAGFEFENQATWDFIDVKNYTFMAGLGLMKKGEDF